MIPHLVGVPCRASSAREARATPSCVRFPEQVEGCRLRLSLEDHFAQATAERTKFRSAFQSAHREFVLHHCLEFVQRGARNPNIRVEDRLSLQPECLVPLVHELPRFGRRPLRDRRLPLSYNGEILAVILRANLLLGCIHRMVFGEISKPVPERNFIHTFC